MFNGRQVGTLPMGEPVRVPVGRFPLEVRAEGYRTVTLDVDIEAGGLSRETVELVRVASAVEHPPVGHAATGTPHPVAPAPAGHGLPTRTVGLAALIGGGVFLVAGAVLHVVRELNADHFNSAGCTTHDTVQPATCQGYLDTVDLTGPLFIAGYAAGGLAVVTGVILLATSSPSRERPPARTGRLGPVVGPGYSGLSYELHF
jgi:hypothetical protein